MSCRTCFNQDHFQRTYLNLYFSHKLFYLKCCYKLFETVLKRDLVYTIQCADINMDLISDIIRRSQFFTLHSFTLKTVHIDTCLAPYRVSNQHTFIKSNCSMFNIYKQLWLWGTSNLILSVLMLSKQGCNLWQTYISIGYNSQVIISQGHCYIQLLLI